MFVFLYQKLTEKIIKIDGENCKIALEICSIRIDDDYPLNMTWENLRSLME